ncbi:unnamed protein product [Cercospora beticola]|nr:unnamed protein product [Cercospora beticola]
MLEPEECFSTCSTKFSSLRAFGLEDTNDKGADYIQLYSDPACQSPNHAVKYSDMCLRLEFRSLMYVPATIDKETRERINATQNVTKSAEQQQADDDLELLLLRMEQAYERTGNVNAMEEVTRQWRMDRSGEQRDRLV